MRISLIIFVCIAGIIMLDACSKQEPAQNPYTRIEGTWKLVATATDENLNGQLDNAEIQAVPKGTNELLKFNYDSTGNEHKPINNVTQDFAFKWAFRNTFHDIIRVITGDTIFSHIDLLTDGALYLRNNDSVYFDSSVIASWKLYQKK